LQGWNFGGAVYNNIYGNPYGFNQYNTMYQNPLAIQGGFFG
jgi:hypothetical protein